MKTPYDFLNKQAPTTFSTPMLPDLTPKAPSMQFPMANGATFPQPMNNPAPVAGPVAPKPVAPTIKTAYQAPQNVLATSGTATKASITPAATVTAPVVTPTTVATPASTVTTTGLGGMTGNIKDIYGDASFYNDRNSWLAGQGVTEAAEKASLADEMQRQINASNALYAEKLRQAKVAGDARLGGTMARNQSRGAVGGSFGSAAVETEQFANQDIYNSIEQEKAAAEGAIRAGIANLAKSYYEDKRAAVEAGYKERIAFKKNEGEYGDSQANAAVEYLIANKATPDSITDKDAKDAGTTLDKIKKAFLVKKYETTQAEKAKTDKIAREDAIRAQEQADKVAFERAKGFSISEGQAQYGYDANGKPVLLASRAKTYAPKDGDTLSSTGMTGNVSPAESSIKLTSLIGTTNEALKLSNAAGAGSIERMYGDTFKGDSEFRQLEALTDAVRTNLLTLNTDPAVKKFFGPQMSNNDVTLMTSAATPLNIQKMTPAQVKKYVTEAKDVFTRAKAAVDQANGVQTSAANTPNAAPATINKIINGVPTVLVRQADGKYYPQK